MNPKISQTVPQNRNLFFLAGCLLFTLLYVIFYPPIYAYRDEGMYLALASVFQKGKFFIENTGIPIQSWIELRGHSLPFYPPGNSLLLLPFLQFGWKAIFWMGLTMHLLAAFFFKKLAQLFDCDSPLNDALYLFFPSFVLYSRTVMSDIPSLALFLMAYYFYFKSDKTKFLAGIFFGITLLFRVSNVIIIFPFFASLLFKAFRDKKIKEWLLFSLGLAPFVLACAVYNHVLYGSVFLTGYSKVFTGVTSLGPQFFKNHFIFYLMALNTAYPLMLISFFLYRRLWRLETVFLTVFLILFFSFYYFHDLFPTPIMNYVFSNRFLYPILPFLLLSYSTFLTDLTRKLPQTLTKALFLGLVSMLILGSAALQARHQKILRHQETSKNLIYDNTQAGDILIYGSNESELMQAVWGSRIYLPFETYPITINKLNNLSSDADKYLILRGAFHGATALPSGIEAELESFRNDYTLNLIQEKNGIRIFKLTSRNS